MINNRLVLDEQKVITLLSNYRPDMQIRDKVGRVSILMRCPCPSHTDKKPSFLYSVDYNHGVCYSCGFKGNLKDILYCFEGSFEAIDKHMEDLIRKKAPSRKLKGIEVPYAQLNEWQDSLTTDVEWRTLMNRWGWDPELIAHLKIGVANGALVIPQYVDSVLTGIKYYMPNGMPKYRNHEGSRIICWGISKKENDDILLCEGEKDCITLLSQGYNAATFTGGANSLPETLGGVFRDKNVFIVYDNDKAGRDGSSRAAEKISTSAREVRIISLPGLDEKGDITDFYLLDPSTFKQRMDDCIQSAEVFMLPSLQSRIDIPPECIPVYLEEITDRKLFFKRISMKVRLVNNAYNDVTVIPRTVKFLCSMNAPKGLCDTCPVRDGVRELVVKPDCPEILSMVKTDTEHQQKVLKTLANIPDTCKKVSIRYETHQALYPIVVIPAIEPNKKKHSYSLIGAWAFDTATKENEDYKVEAVVMANPDTQKMEIVCYKMQKDHQSLDEFELNEEQIQDLEVFKCPQINIS